MDCTVEELIGKLQELGDENWRKFAKVRVVDLNGAVLDFVDAFDVKFNSTSADIVLDYEEEPELDPIWDSNYDDDDDWSAWDEDYDGYCEEDEDEDDDDVEGA